MSEKVTKLAIKLNEWENSESNKDVYWTEFVTHTIHKGASGDTAVVYAGLGLSGEVGECTEHLKKSVRDGFGIGPIDPKVQPKRYAAFKDELSDVLWYVTRLASLHGISLKDLQHHNMKKLLKKWTEIDNGN